jgi:hypothetical protein
VVVDDKHNQMKNIEEIIPAASHAAAAQAMLQELADMPMEITDAMLVYVFFEAEATDDATVVMLSNLKRREEQTGREGWTAHLDNGRMRPITDDEWKAIVDQHSADFVGAFCPKREEDGKKEKRKRG